MQRIIDALPSEVKALKGFERLPYFTLLNLTLPNLTKPNAQSEGNQVNEIMDIFHKINPTLNWGHKNIRKSAQDLIDLFGFEETKMMAKEITAVQGRQYAPVATTPSQMKEKLAQFKIYFDKENKKIIPELKL